MINTSTEFQQAHARNSACIVKANILLKDGTQLNVDNSQISQGATKIDDGVSGSNTFEIGSAIVNKLTLNLNNRYDEFSDYDFTDAVTTAWVGKQLPSRIEWLKKGVYNTDDPTSTPAILTLECLDNMSKFDQAYDSGMTFPTTLQAMVQYCCTRCGVLLANAQFPNYLYEISRDPFGGTDNITYRAIIAYCALLAGCYARCNVDGRLELKWYDTAAFSGDVDGGIFDQTTELSYQTGDNLDGGNFTDYSSGDTADGGTFTDVLPYHHIYSFSSLSVSTEDVVITGIRVTAADSEDESGNKVEGETYLCGAEGYILDVSGNPLIESGKAREVAEYLAGRIVGMRFRPFQASAIGDPSWEAGDAAIITDRKGNSYYTYLTNITYSTGSYASISCDAEPAARHSADRYAEINKIVSDIKKDNQQKLSQYAQYVDQLNTLAINAMGYYETVEKQDDGSMIKYMHDKPLLSESQTIFKNSIDGFFWSRDGGKTYTFGVSKDGNAVMSVIAAIGIAAEWIDTRGFKATDDAGNVTFEIDANTGKVRIVCESFSLTGKSIEEISQMATEDIINAVASDLQAQVDGKIESYNQSSDPSTAWTSTAVKQAHTGDYWYWNGITKRWDGVSWTELPATDKVAQEIAKSKMKVFISQPIPPYNAGDLWVQGVNGDIMKCKTARTSGSYNAADWERASKYTDDSSLENFISGDYAESLKEIEGQVDKKAETWKQASDPAATWTTDKLKFQHKGDLWYDTNNQRAYIYTGSAWEEMKANPPDIVFDSIDGKAQIFTSQPTPPYYIGDLWVQGGTGDIMRCKTARASGNYTASDWEKASKYTDDSAVKDLDEKLGKSQEIFSRLTNNGAIQGIYMQSGQLYVNAKYMVTGILASKNGRVYFDLDNNILACSKMVSADTGQGIQTVADVGYQGGPYSSGGSRLRVYPQGHEESAVQIYANTSNMGYVEGPSEKMAVRCANARTAIDTYPEQMTLSAFPKVGSSSAKYAKVELLSTGSSYSTGNVEIGPRLSVKGPLTVSGTFTASGTKSRVIETENYSRRLQYCYEMAVPMFGDAGEGQTDESGECCVVLDDVFAETVAAGIEYQVFLQKEGPGDIWISEKYSEYFIVRGTENLKFAWEIKVKQKDFEYTRLENADIREQNVSEILNAYEEEYVTEVVRYIEEQEELIYETA